ncbi:MAG: type II toxin-antitoxin system VapC family toxin [Desulfococcaceae bacterium]|jgi:tRNA(fMet)-specific endonuclease VapC|nr:type II toxin-antitoxin system VapC family toxin [Desulfococcaceae bacterium]
MNHNLRYLLDTNIISELIRNPHGPVTDRIAREGEAGICTSIVVAAELRFGAVKKNSARLTRQLEAVLSAIEILPLNEPADREYAKLRYQLEKAGTPIGPNDMLIAAHALSLNLTLVTANQREFSRVSGLLVENWMHYDF